MREPPRVRYTATADGPQIAYQVFGEGPPDFVLLPEWATHLDMLWGYPGFVSHFDQWASLGRGLLFDKRGIGLSDSTAPQNPPTMDQWMDDLMVVLGAAGIDNCAVVGMGHGGQMAALLAATHPNRVTHLVIVNSYARLRRAADFDLGMTDEQADTLVARIAEEWGTAANLPYLTPSRADDDDLRSHWSRFQRATASPSAAAAVTRTTLDIDIRHVLPTIRVPTLVLHTRDNRVVPEPLGRGLAEQIPGCRYEVFDGGDHWWWLGESGDAMLAAIGEFVVGTAPPPNAERALATLLLTDIYESTTRAAELGDRAWRSLLDRFDDAVERLVDRAGGRAIKHTGDGHLLAFDRPSRAIECALDLRHRARALELELRIGLHTGEVEQRGDDLAGIGVHIAARVMGMAGPGEVLVSGAVPPLVAGSGIEFGDRGTHELKGVPGEWQLFEVIS